MLAAILLYFTPNPPPNAQIYSQIIYSSHVFLILDFVTIDSTVRRGSLVKETLKNRILILRDTSKESDFYL